MSPGPRSPEAKLKRAERTAQSWRDKVRRLELQELEMVQSSLWPSIPEDEHNAAVDCPSSRVICQLILSVPAVHVH
jgi:hypothetical protein